MKATAIAHPNIALTKYWGKKPGAHNVPAVPSLSVTLDGLATTTTVTFGADASVDSLTINGASADVARATLLLDEVRKAAGMAHRASIVSTNDFPTASGLASSASGFAALAVAAVRAAGLDWPAEKVADLARQSSAVGRTQLVRRIRRARRRRRSRQVGAPGKVDLREILVCVTTEEAKAVSSRSGMNETAAKSPYYAAWLSGGPKIHHAMKAALLANDIPRVGELAEESALAMHFPRLRRRHRLRVGRATRSTRTRR